MAIAANESVWIKERPEAKRPFKVCYTRIAPGTWEKLSLYYRIDHAQRVTFNEVLPSISAMSKMVACVFKDPRVRCIEVRDNSSDYIDKMQNAIQDDLHDYRDNVLKPNGLWLGNTVASKISPGANDSIIMEPNVLYIEKVAA